MLPTLMSVPPIGSDWLHEVKHDGWRLVARLDRSRPDAIALWSLPGRDWNAQFSRIAAAVAALPAGHCVLDGEAVWLGADGRADFHALRGHADEAELVAFDLLALEWRDLRGEPLEARRAALGELLAEPPEGLRFSQALQGVEGATVLRHACAMGLEGIVSKRLGSRFRSGVSWDWRKVRCESYVRTSD